MGCIKKLLMFLGVVFVVLIVAFVLLGRSGASFRADTEPFISTFMADLSANWNIADVNGRLTTACMAQASSPDGRRALAQFSSLGALVSIDDLALGNYTFGTSGHIGAFTFNARFANGAAVAEITVVKRDGVLRVQELNITPVGPDPTLPPAGAEV